MRKILKVERTMLKTKTAIKVAQKTCNGTPPIKRDAERLIALLKVFKAS